MNKPGLGDMVRVKDGETGVVQGGTLSQETHTHTSYVINTTYSDGFSTCGEPWIEGVDPERVELVEKAWVQKWQKRCYGR